ncbi:hypothetical protein ASPZODRAFT_114822 [Penicilliopsis zonata CBS 506.65]|uniref:F-box domain-containing protein n=1 Tax=Penicilliopsis zonata CBS 506.65 TaxID=1073090 RepID=A0A1L9SKW6_9EURO|nr:hypothetical protein ASPZODRAFT_114822 [Penicilliopsis zonata CBS 506.65]OJJ47756.1 hypothetical protein ASPZODRAFT_114822 [Penicilliopsis zonata CBS 506.65]
MLADLPSEIIYEIATHLLTASALASLSQTCRRLNQIVTAEDSRIFRALVKSRFPYIQTPSFWRDAAQALTARSRALDRHAVIARFVLPAEDAVKIGSHRATRRDNPTLGYRPAIDSYELWTGGKWADKREVVAWGAADELMIRIKESGASAGEKWLVFNDLDHISSYDDICGVHLLKPTHHSAREDGHEHLIFGRVRGDLVHLAVSPEEKTHEYRQKFVTHGQELVRTDLSNGNEPILAAHFDNGSIGLYHTVSEEAEVEPFGSLRLESADSGTRHGYSKFLSPSRIAVGTGGLMNSLSICTITPETVSVCREIGVESLDLEERAGMSWKATVSGIAPLTCQTAGGASGDVFLAAWGDRAIRVHDLRSPEPFVSTYRDETDNNPVYSLQPFGHDRFLVGAGGDSVLKIFDLRMQTTCKHLDSQHGLGLPPPTPSSRMSSMADGPRNRNPGSRKNFSLFLSYNPPVNGRGIHYQRRRHRTSNDRSYRGPIYTLSSPSPSSPTIYAGIIDGVLQLDFASADDLTGSCRKWYEDNLSLNLDWSRSAPLRTKILDLSGYERPDADDLTTTSRLRTQRPFESLEAAETESGWDQRWEPLDDGAWRRRAQDK